MPYISKEKVKEIRNELKKTFPKVKFSVVRSHHSSIDVCIMESPFDFGDNDTPVNHYYIKDSYSNKEHRDFLQKVTDIATRDKKTDFIDGDYGAVPNYYFSLRIGKWDKKYKITGNLFQ